MEFGLESELHRFALGIEQHMARILDRHVAHMGWILDSEMGSLLDGHMDWYVASFLDRNVDRNVADVVGHVLE